MSKRVALLGAAIGMVAVLTAFPHAGAQIAFPQADFIVVLDRGRVVECGTHVALLEQNGLYGRIYRSQQRTERAALSGSSE